MKQKNPYYTLAIVCFIVVAVGIWMGQHTAFGQDENLPTIPVSEPSNRIYLPTIFHPRYIYFPSIRSAPPFYNPWPSNQSLRQSLNTYLTWDVLTEDLRDAKFKIYLEANNPTPTTVVADNLTVQSFDPATFEENTLYYWQVVATLTDGTRFDGDIWSFRTDYFPDIPEIGTMVTVPAGEFMMGCDPQYPGHSRCLVNQVPLHPVYLDSFEVDKFEVTNKEYRACTQAGACNLPRKFTSNRDDPYFYNPRYDYYPVLFVSHWDAQDYCRWVGKRLPTEAEWEKAARGTIDTRPWTWGVEDWDCTRVNRCSGQPARVDDYRTNQSPYGAVNLTGNVFEWVEDLYYDYFYYISPYENPVNTEMLQSDTIPFFSIRGGSYADNFHYARVNHRSGGHHGDYPMHDTPLFRSFRVGFRCARSLTPD